MKKIVVLFLGLMISSFVYADGIQAWQLKANENSNSLLMKPLSLASTTYAPDPNSAGIGSAFNIYGGFGKAISFGLDYEFQVIDPNLTLGPQFLVDIPFRAGGVHIDGGVIARYYADWLIPNMPDKFDSFITSNTGIGFIPGSTPYLYVGTAIGGRWNFTESMSLYLQLGIGYNTSNVYVGLSWKL